MPTLDDEWDVECSFVGFMGAGSDALVGTLVDDDLDLDEELVAAAPTGKARRGGVPRQRSVFQCWKYRNEEYQDVTEELRGLLLLGLV